MFTEMESGAPRAGDDDGCLVLSAEKEGRVNDTVDDDDDSDGFGGGGGEAGSRQHAGTRRGSLIRADSEEMADEPPARKPSPTSLAMGERLSIGERRWTTGRSTWL